jgi:ABC-type multidrug transport system ATPase subunit
VLILDEPTTGVDPVSRKEFWDMLERLKSEGITVLVSTAYMDEASLCDRIALMREGSFIASDTPQNIINRYTETLWAVQTEDLSASLRDLRAHPQVKTCFAFGNEHHVTVQPDLPVAGLQCYLQEKGYSKVRINVATPTVEDCFMALTSET